MVEFAHNMGVSLRRFLDGDGEALASLLRWGGLTASELATLQSWSGEPLGDVRMLFRGEVFVSRALRNPTVRGCPVCLREDAVAHSGDAAQAMAIRGDWQLREVTLCLRHHHLLVPLWHADNRYERFDFAQHFRRIEPELQSGKFDLPLSAPTEYDLWLDQRLETGKDETWLADHGLYPSTTFCRLLGMEILRLHDAPRQNEMLTLRSAQEAGFAVARQGGGAISATFMALAEASGGKREEPKAVFGNLFSKLQQDYRNDPAFEPFRRLLRACILNAWPVAAGEAVLGEVQTERRLHSLYSAARDFGVGVEFLEPFLIEAGALSPHDTRFANRRVFSAADHAELLAEVPTLVSIRTLKREIGASRTELDRLIAEDILVPRVKNENVRLRWSLVKAKNLLSSLQAHASSVPQSEPGWEPFLAASNRSRLSLSILLDAVLNGTLAVGAAGSGFRDLRLRKVDVDRLAPLSDAPMLEALIPATAFGISVGIKDKGRFRKLIQAGHTPATPMRNPRTGIANIYMTTADIAAFHQRFVTMSTLAAETWRSIPELRSALTRAGVAVFSPEGEDFGRLFLRKAAVSALARGADRRV